MAGWPATPGYHHAAWSSHLKTDNIVSPKQSSGIIFSRHNINVSVKRAELGTPFFLSLSFLYSPPSLFLSLLSFVTYSLFFFLSCFFSFFLSLFFLFLSNSSSLFFPSFSYSPSSFLSVSSFLSYYPYLSSFIIFLFFFFINSLLPFHLVIFSFHIISLSHLLFSPYPHFLFLSLASFWPLPSPPPSPPVTILTQPMAIAGSRVWVGGYRLGNLICIIIRSLTCVETQPWPSFSFSIPSVCWYPLADGYWR